MQFGLPHARVVKGLAAQISQPSALYHYLGVKNGNQAAKEKETKKA